MPVAAQPVPVRVSQTPARLGSWPRGPQWGSGSALGAPAGRSGSWLSTGATSLVPGPGQLGAQILDLGDETGQLSRTGFGQLGGAGSSGLGSCDLSLRSGPDAVQLGAMASGEHFGDLGPRRLERPGVLGTQICQGLVVTCPLRDQLLPGGLGDALGPGPGCLGFYQPGFSGSGSLDERLLGLGPDSRHLGCVLGSKGL